MATVSEARRAISTHAPWELLRWLFFQVAPKSSAAEIPLCMSCIVFMSPDALHLLRRQAPPPGPARLTSAAGERLLPAAVAEPPTLRSIAHARASAWDS